METEVDATIKKMKLLIQDCGISLSVCHLFLLLSISPDAAELKSSNISVSHIWAKLASSKWE